MSFNFCHKPLRMIAINSVEIKNFKSVRNLELSDCRDINVIIGRPNVGKSNILEALSLFDVPYLIGSKTKSLKSLIRLDNASELFYNGESNKSIEVKADNHIASLFSAPGTLTLDISNNEDPSRYSFNNVLQLTTKRIPTYLPPILTYFFPKHFEAEQSNFDFLLPPSGINLSEIVSRLSSLKEELADLFHAFGLKLVFDKSSSQIKAMKEDGHDMFLVPYTSLSDSLQRLIFYKAAIRSNTGKVLCFEEPEAHTFPPYISNIVNDIIECEDNQFFISTHSPYVVSSLLESAGNRLAVYIVDMKDNATVVRRLEDSDLQNVYDNGLDMFFNIDYFKA